LKAQYGTGLRRARQVGGYKLDLNAARPKKKRIDLEKPTRLKGESAPDQIPANHHQPSSIRMKKKKGGSTLGTKTIGDWE